MRMSCTAWSLEPTECRWRAVFVVTEECDASDAYKHAYLNANESDVQIIQSPVGMPGRAVRNGFIRGLEKEKQHITRCYNCLEKCNPATVPYCITKALIAAVKGDMQNGLVFCGANVGPHKPDDYGPRAYE